MLNLKVVDSRVGILAYGSLINDPGSEITPLIVDRRETKTPFPVEYGRYSSTRGEAATLVPHERGAPVRAQLLVLNESVGLEGAMDLLWRREVRKEGSGQSYRSSNSRNAVLVKTLKGLDGTAYALYTDFNPEGKLAFPESGLLAAAAIKSVRSAPRDRDGITYLMAARAAGVETPLTSQYVSEILRRTGTATLAEALQAARSSGST